jgi:hypothetical protein
MKPDVKLVKSFAMRAFGLVALLFGMAPLQAGTIGNGIILQLGLDSGATDVLFISVVGSKNSSTPCSTNPTWDYILPLNSEHAKRMYAMLLTARVSGTPVTLAGSSACATMDIEILHAVYY